MKLLCVSCNKLFFHLQVWFQNRRAKFRKRDNTKKGPGRPAHNAHPQTCSGEPMDPEEIKRREQERLDKKRRKQEERLRKMEEKRKLLDANDTEGHRKLQEEYEQSNAADQLNDLDDSKLDKSFDDEPEVDVVEQKKGFSAFSIDRLLGEPKSSKSRLQNSKYPLGHTYSSVGGIGMFSMYSITQPIGFVVEQRQDDVKSSENMDLNSSSEEGHEETHINTDTVQYRKESVSSEHHYSESDVEDDHDIDVTDDEVVNH